jgi:hypothetical protein
MHVVPPAGGDIPIADGFGESEEAGEDDVTAKYKSMVSARAPGFIRRSLLSRGCC